MNFESQQIRAAAIGLINRQAPLSRKVGGFLGQVIAQPDPLSSKQRKWLDDLLVSAGVEPVEETPVPLPGGWTALVFVAWPGEPDDECNWDVVTLRKATWPKWEILATFPADQKSEAEAWARQYALRTPGCIFGGGEE